MNQTWDAPGRFGFTDGGKRTGTAPTVNLGRNPTCQTCGGRQRAGPKTKKCTCADPAWNGKELCRRDRDAFIAFLSTAMRECLRILKPGAYGLVWALPRTSHWTATALEDAGFEIRDRIAHLFGQGFPKAKSCLKPAVEDWWLVRKPGPKVLPLPGLDACRIACSDHPGVHKSMSNNLHEGYRRPWRDNGLPEYKETPAGRYPANLCLSHHEECRCVGTRKVKPLEGHRPNPVGQQADGNIIFNHKPPGFQKVSYTGADGTEEVEAWECHPDCPVRLLDEQSGERPGDSLGRKQRRQQTQPGSNGTTLGQGWSLASTKGYTDSGGASRFFFTPKASRKDRGEGNDHPTVKSQPLMQWLVRLITPPGGLVLDPFAGSGSTLLACQAEGFRCVGIEKDAHYHAIAQARLAAEEARTPLFAGGEP